MYYFYVEKLRRILAQLCCIKPDMPRIILCKLSLRQTRFLLFPSNLLFAIFLLAMSNGDVPSGSNLASPAEEVSSVINLARQHAGLPPLTINSLLNLAAQNHVYDMIQHNHYSHIGTDGSNVDMRIARTGYRIGGWAGENWVSVHEPSQAIQWWMRSSIHRQNILNPNWTELGIGYGEHGRSRQSIFVVVFTTGHTHTDHSASFDSVQSTASAPLPKSYANSSSSNYVIQAGDTLMSIALRHGIDWQILAAHNGLHEHSILQIGAALNLPTTSNRK